MSAVIILYSTYDLEIDVMTLFAYASVKGHVSAVIILYSTYDLEIDVMTLFAYASVKG